MKILFIVLIPLYLLQNVSQASPKISFEDLMIQVEQNPQSAALAKAEAIKLQLPVNIFTTDKIKIDVKSIEDGRPVYTVITDFLNPFNGGYTAFYEDITSEINLENARIYYGNGYIIDNTRGFSDPVTTDNRGVLQYLMIPDITNDKVLLFNAQNGDLVDDAFIPTSSIQLATPKEAEQSRINSDHILVCDQIRDAVQEFDVFGSYIGIFAPAGGVNTSILDNIRGMEYRPNNNLLVTVGQGASTNTIQQFDPSGNPLGAFINTGLNSPFDILHRQNDILVTNFSGTNRISRYDLNGNFISSFYTGSAFTFPQQMHRLPNGNILVAASITTSGIAVLDSNGTFLRLINPVTGNRGVYLLGNGHYLTTTDKGVYEIDSASGGLIRTVATGNFQYISSYQASDFLLSLKIKLEACIVTDTIVVELRSSTPPYNLVESQIGLGGLGVARIFRFSSATNGTPYYIAVKHRNSIETWSSNTFVFVGNNQTYDFTSAVTQAFGNNMTDVGGMWSFYQGDIDQNGPINLSDILAIANDATSFVTGSYVLTDLNCDGAVNLTDILFASNNFSNFIQVRKP